MRRKTKRRLLAGICAAGMILAVLAGVVGAAAGTEAEAPKPTAGIGAVPAALPAPAKTPAPTPTPDPATGTNVGHTPEPEPTPEPAPAPLIIAELGLELSGVLEEACAEHGVRVALAVAVIEKESTFDPYALNTQTNCYGLMQLNPRYFPSDLSPADNIRTGVAYLGEHLKNYDGDEAHALTAYYYGPTDRETCAYSDAVLALAAKWEGVCGT